MSIFGNQYEYWPTMAFYWPIYLWGPWQAIRAGHPCFFSALNPGMEGGGIGFGSKYEIGQMIPERHNPATIRIMPDASHEEALKDWDRLKERCLKNGRGNENDPFVAKPDIGYRGRLVKVLNSPQDLKTYRERYPLPMLLQEKISWPEEYGILYFRRWRDSPNLDILARDLEDRDAGRKHSPNLDILARDLEDRNAGGKHSPNLDILARDLEDRNAGSTQTQGTITSLTTKEFLSVTGDGQKSMAELLSLHPRGSTQLERLKREFGQALDRIPELGERVPLGEIGNHNLGTRFIDARHLITPALIKQFDQLADEMPGFCYGRFDIKAKSLNAVEQGEFMVLEINGALAEPTHLYDADKNNYFTAVRDIMAHWQIIGTLSRENMRLGARPMSLVSMLKKLYWFRGYAKKVKRLIANESID